LLPRTRLVAAVLVGGAFLTAACGGAGDGSSSPDAETSVTNLAFVDPATPTTSTTLIAAAPDVVLSESDAEYVRFEATWVCEVQRRTFPTQDAQAQALLDKLADFGLNSDDYHAFRARVNQDQGLRDSILFTYQETCRP
jgi:hypothetical protein